MPGAWSGRCLVCGATLLVLVADDLSATVKNTKTPPDLSGRVVERRFMGSPFVVPEGSMQYGIKNVS